MHIEIPYTPRKEQQVLHDNRTQFNVFVCHRRFGKTVACINELGKEALQNTLKRPRYAYFAPYYKQAKAIAWDYVKEFMGVIPGVKFNESELRCDLPNTARISLYGADKPDAIRGLYFDGVILDEFCQMTPSFYTEVILPCLADRNGWIIFIGTPKGMNAFYDTLQLAMEQMDLGNKDYYAAVFKNSETNIVSSDFIDHARLAGMSDEEIEQEFECSFTAAIIGAYYGKNMAKAERESRICDLPWEPSIQVDTAWDLGIGDSTAIWFIQQDGRRVNVIDYYEMNGEGLDHYAKVLSEKPYVYRDHYLPHDVEVRSLSTGITRRDTLRSLGIDSIVVDKLPVADGINASRLLLSRCYFDKVKCKQGIEALKQYKRQWNEKQQVFNQKPLHDWTSHAADAWRYLSLAIRPPDADRLARMRHNGMIQQVSLNDYDMFGD